MAAVQVYLADCYNFPTYTRVDPNVFATRESTREWMDNLDIQNWQDMQTLMHYSPQLQQVYTQLDISEAFDTMALWTRGRRDIWASEPAAREAEAAREPDCQHEDEDQESQDNNDDTAIRSNKAESKEDDNSQREVAGVLAPKTLSDIIHSDYWVRDMEQPLISQMMQLE